MEVKFIKPKLSRMSQLQTNSDKLPELKDKCFMGPTEFFLADSVYLELSETLRPNLKSLEESQEL